MNIILCIYDCSVAVCRIVLFVLSLIVYVIWKMSHFARKFSSAVKEYG